MILFSRKIILVLIEIGKQPRLPFSFNVNKYVNIYLTELYQIVKMYVRL